MVAAQDPMVSASLPPITALTTLQALRGLRLRDNWELTEALELYVRGYIDCCASAGRDDDADVISGACAAGTLAFFAEYPAWNGECPWDRLPAAWRDAAMASIVRYVRDGHALAGLFDGEEEEEDVEEEEQEEQEEEEEEEDEPPRGRTRHRAGSKSLLANRLRAGFTAATIHPPAPSDSDGGSRSPEIKTANNKSNAVTAIASTTNTTKKRKGAGHKVKTNGATGETYDVWSFKRILNSRLDAHGDVEYRVQWTYQKPSWQPATDLVDNPEDIAEFHDRHPAKPGPPAWFKRTKKAKKGRAD